MRTRWHLTIGLISLVGVASASVMAQTPSAMESALTFEVVSIKPNRSGESRSNIAVQPGGRVAWTNITLRSLIETSPQRSGFDPRESIGGPDWIDRDRFDVIAHAPAGATLVGPDGFPGPAFAMIRAMLADRFRVLVHAEDRERPIYELRLARADGSLGRRLTRSTIDCGAAMKELGAGGRLPRLADGRVACAIGGPPGRILSAGLGMVEIANILSGRVDRPVIDRTGLTGPFDLDLEFAPDSGGPEPLPSDKPSIFSALQEQLGLRLEPARGQISVLVIDRAEPPTPD